MMAVRLDDIENVLALGGGSIAIVISFHDRHSNDPSDYAFTIRAENIIRVFVILKL